MSGKRSSAIPVKAKRRGLVVLFTSLIFIAAPCVTYSCGRMRRVIGSRNAQANSTSPSIISS
jgi:hypothetical protein